MNHSVNQALRAWLCLCLALIVFSGFAFGEAAEDSIMDTVFTDESQPEAQVATDEMPIQCKEASCPSCASALTHDDGDGCSVCPECGYSVFDDGCTAPHPSLCGESYESDLCDVGDCLISGEAVPIMTRKVLHVLVGSEEPYCIRCERTEAEWVDYYGEEYTATHSEWLIAAQLKEKYGVDACAGGHVKYANPIYKKLDAESHSFKCLVCGERIAEAHEYKKGMCQRCKFIQPLTSFAFAEGESVTIGIGEVYTFEMLHAPEEAVLGFLTWHCSNGKVAKWANETGGAIEGLAEGSATVTVTYRHEEADVTLSNAIRVKVIDRSKLTNVAIVPLESSTLDMDETLQLYCTVTPEEIAGQTKVTWKSSAPKFITVDAETGLLTPVGQGAATITATARKDGITKTASVRLTVTDDDIPDAVSLGEIPATLGMDEVLQLTPVLTPEHAKAEFSWKSSSTKIANVADGRVTPVAEGTVTITVTATRGIYRKTASAKIKVVDAYKPADIKLNETGTQTLYIDEVLPLTYTLTPTTDKPAVADRIEWSTSSAKIATVVEGVVEPVAEGTATIGVTATRGGKKYKSSVKVKVVDPYKHAGVSIAQGKAVTLYLGGESMPLFAVLKPTTEKTPTADITWKSSSEKVVVVDGEGRIAPVALGKATITATAVHGKVKKTATTKVTVADPKKLDAVTIAPTEMLNVCVGEALVLKATTLPPTAEGCAVAWKSSSTKIATVDEENGTVIGVKAGTATITATATQAGIRKTATVKVKVLPEP